MTRTLLVDLHTHSLHSDGLPSIAAIEDHCQRRGLGIALTDHNEIRGAMQLLARDKIPCIPAVEVGTKEGLEFLVYFSAPARLEEFYVRSVEPYLLRRFMVRSRIRAVPCLEVARDLGGFVSLAHPYAFGRKSLKYHERRSMACEAFLQDVLRQIDAVEHFNAGVRRPANSRAAGLHLAWAKKITVGSDSHRLSGFGTAGVGVNGDMDSRHADLFAELHQNDFPHRKTGKHNSLLLTIPIIAFKHTRFFIRSRSGRRRSHPPIRRSC